MKRIILLSILFTITQMVSVSAASLKALGEKGEIVNVVERNNEVFQTKYTASNVGITVGAKVIDSKLRYDLEIANNSKKDIFFDTDYIRVFQGNNRNGQWYSMKYKNTGYPVTSKNEKDSSKDNTSTENAASDDYEDSSLSDYIAAGVVIAAVAVGTFLLFKWLRDSDDEPIDIDFSPKIHKKEKPVKKWHKPEPNPKPSITIYHDFFDHSLFYDFIDVLDDDIYIDLTEQKDNHYPKAYDTLNSGTIEKNSSLFGSFYLDEGLGPDYRIEIEIPGQEIVSFIFTGNQSDLFYSSNDYGFEKTERNKMMLGGGWNVLNTGGGSIYFMSLGQSIGGYCSTGFRMAIKDFPVIGTVKEHNCNVVNFSSNDEHGKFYPDGESLSDAYNFSGGVTEKICPGVWLLAGCGLDLTYKYYSGVFQSDGGQSYSAFVEDKTPDFVIKPQLGLNFSIGAIDTGVMFKYPIQGEPELDLIFGISF